jgi:hypothetical protein
LGEGGAVSPVKICGAVHPDDPRIVCDCSPGPHDPHFGPAKPGEIAVKWSTPESRAAVDAVYHPPKKPDPIALGRQLARKLHSSVFEPMPEPGTKKRTVLAMVHASAEHGVTAGEIAEWVGFERGTVSGALRSLAEQARVVQTDARRGEGRGSSVWVSGRNANAP